MPELDDTAHGRQPGDGWELSIWFKAGNAATSARRCIGGR